MTRTTSALALTQAPHNGETAPPPPAARPVAVPGWIVRLLIAGTMLVVLLAAPLAALAEDDPKADARLEGYKEAVALESGGGVGMTWLLFLLVSAIACSVLFKSAKRSHLD